MMVACTARARTCLQGMTSAATIYNTISLYHSHTIPWPNQGMQNIRDYLRQWESRQEREQGKE